MGKQEDGLLRDAAHEERKARMRAYYRANKEKWRKYRCTARMRMTDAEQDKKKKKQREYSGSYYQAHRAGILARTTRYQKKNAVKFAAYRAEWHQENKRRVAERRRRHYHAVVKPRRQAAKAASEFLTIRDAVTLLGAKLRAFREWVYAGRIEAVKTPGGRYLIRRDSVERIRAELFHLPRRIKKQLGLVHEGVRNEQ